MIELVGLKCNFHGYNGSKLMFTASYLVKKSCVCHYVTPVRGVPTHHVKTCALTTNKHSNYFGRALTSKLPRRRQSRTLLDFAVGTSEDKVGY